MNHSEFHIHAKRVDDLVQRVSAITDPEARNAALELLQSTMDLHGAVISRMVELLENSEDAGHKMLAKLASDPMICGLLVLYGIHPVPLDQRVRDAVQRLAPQLRKSGVSLQVLGIMDGVVRLDLQKENNGRSSPEKIKSSIEQAILEAAPEVVEIIIEGLTSSFVPIEMIQPASKEETSYEESAA